MYLPQRPRAAARKQPLHNHEEEEDDLNGIVVGEGEERGKGEERGERVIFRIGSRHSK
jgi:hypothetical protein